MKIENSHIIIAVIWVLFYSAHAQAQSELSESTELKVTCPNRLDYRILNYNLEKKLWCDTALNDFCKPFKVDAARLACSKKYASTLGKLSIESKQNVATTVIANESRNALLSSERERIQLEQELLEIQEKQLNIRRRQVELEKELVRLTSL